MSLKEWKDNEINTKLMKKWGLLKEEKNEPADVAKADDELAGEEAGEDAADELEEGMPYRDEDEDLEEGVFGFKSADEKRKELADRAEFSAGGPQEDDPGVDAPTAWALQKAKHDKLPKDTRTRTPRGRSHASGPAAGSRNVFSMGEGSRKISVREAKEITRRIIERVKKESK